MSLLLITVLVPLAGGAAVTLFHARKARNCWTIAVVLMTSVLAWNCILRVGDGACTFMHLTDTLALTFRLDALGRIFAGLVSVLWPLSTLYGFTYMEDDAYPGLFFMLYTMTFGVTLGIAFSGSLLTLYFFYEFLTLFTVVLVMHGFRKPAVHAARKYLYYSLGGSALAFIGMVFLLVYAGGTDFVPGGLLNPGITAEHAGMLRLVYVLTFCGFSAKAAVFPLHAWLPEAAVAPTPVTALLHAVAVVKAGVFAVTRVTLFCFGTEFLRGTWPQTVVQLLVMFTILLGSVMAVKESHVKRRMAWSTVSNLSYVLLGVTLMTPEGVTAGLLHMVVHAVMKIALFFCCGEILHMTGREYLSQMNGIGRRMPLTCGCFLAAGLSLIGIPPMGGFFSKWYLASAALESGSGMGIAGACVLIAAAVLTAVYVLTTAVRFWFPSSTAPAGVGGKPLEEIREADWKMQLPILLCTAAALAAGLCAGSLYGLLARLTAAMF